MEPSTAEEHKFFQQLTSKSGNVLLYEDTYLQQMALQQIPLEELTIRASKKQSLGGNDTDDDIVKELLSWFKHEFFKWVDVPTCDKCGNDTANSNIVEPLSYECKWGANTVESYTCKLCQNIVRFPRYNHPQKLLETRKGRCGEWANCFTLLCRAIGYEARLVMDWTDHVWTEIFSPLKKRWIHCDPCENIYDSPLIYEQGWKKKVTYVIAFSKDEVQDVTWRYTRNFSEVIQRRSLCRESWLLSCIMFFTKKLQTGLTQNRKSELLYLKINELVEFLTPQGLKGEESKGRTSGSLIWRLHRGECNVDMLSPHQILSLTASEINSKCFHLKYNCAHDKYVRDSDDFSEYCNWESLVFEGSCVFRKIEHDWNMVYIARQEGSTRGHITWKFDFKESRLFISSVHLHLQSQVFENGVVNWTLISGEQRIQLTGGKMTIRSIEGQSEFSLGVELLGGKGDAAWQHAQLFRQHVHADDFPLEIKVFFK